MKRRGITRRHPGRDEDYSLSSLPSPSLKALSRLVQTTISGDPPPPPATKVFMDTTTFADLWHDTCSRIGQGQPSHSVAPRFVDDLIKHLALQPEDVFYVLGSGTGAVALQVAAQTGCRVVGVEGNKDEHNAAVALKQAFNAKVAEGKRYKQGRTDFLCVDVLESVPAGLGKATVVFVNNLKLSPLHNQRIRRVLVLHLQHGPTRVVSLQELGDSKTLEFALPPPQHGEKEDSRRKTSHNALEALGDGGDEKGDSATELQLDLDALLAEYESKDGHSSRTSRNRRGSKADGDEEESEDESDGEIDYEMEIEKSRKELAVRKELHRRLCAVERKNLMRCIELSEQRRAYGYDVAKPTAEDLELAAEMVRYRAEVRRRINEKLEDQLKRERLAKCARIAAEEAEAKRARKEKRKKLRERRKSARAERRKQQQLTKERHEAEARERERRKQEQLERERLAAERHEAERLAQERLERERLEREQREREAETERREAARLEKERMMEEQEQAREQERVNEKWLETERRDMDEEEVAEVGEEQRFAEEALKEETKGKKREREREERTSPAKPTRAATDQRKRRKVRSNDDADYEEQETITGSQEEAWTKEAAAGEEPSSAWRDEEQESAGDGPAPRRRRGPTRQVKGRKSTPAGAGGADREKEKETSRRKSVPVEKKKKEQSKNTKKRSAKKKKTATKKKKGVEEEVEEEFVYKVERIVAERKRHGRIEYLLKWLGYPEEENSWEPKCNLRDADGTLMATFRREQKEQQLKQQQPQQQEEKT